MGTGHGTGVSMRARKVLVTAVMLFVAGWSAGTCPVGQPTATAGSGMKVWARGWSSRGQMRRSEGTEADPSIDAESRLAPMPVALDIAGSPQVGPRQTPSGRESSQGRARGQAPH